LLTERRVAPPFSDPLSQENLALFGSTPHFGAGTPPRSPEVTSESSSPRRRRSCRVARRRAGLLQYHRAEPAGHRRLGAVKWRNGDTGTSGGAYGGGTPGTTHDITADTQGLFDSGSLAPGGTFSHTFTAAGTYHYHCSIHPSMTGIIVVNP
jgi:hypothetical protein